MAPEQECEQLKAQRDALLAACEAAKEFYYNGSGEASAVAKRAAQMQEQIDAAIALAKGETDAQ